VSSDLPRVAVVEADPELRPQSEGWQRLAKSVADASPDLLVLNELPFGPWLPQSDAFDMASFERSVADHEAGIAALGELGAPALIGTRLALVDGVRVNQGFTWTREDGLRLLHTKQHIPFSPGYWESAWYEPLPGEPATVEIAGLRVGVLICTEVMFNEHARHFGREGVQLIAVPRATPPITAHMFDVALQMAAVASGAYVASSNRSLSFTHESLFEGRGRIVSPLGETVAQTSPFAPVAVHEVNLDFVAWKQSQYPCDVPDEVLVA
jgi:N-carbamoylputrescine amidase